MKDEIKSIAKMDVAPMPCWCGSKLYMDTENEIYICAGCGNPEEECDCE
jgi:hypothetical protein